jgi:hypothetical protein
MVGSGELPPTKAREDTPYPGKSREAVKIQRWWRKLKIFSSKELSGCSTPARNPFAG